MLFNKPKDYEPFMSRDFASKSNTYLATNSYYRIDLLYISGTTTSYSKFQVSNNEELIDKRAAILCVT